VRRDPGYEYCGDEDCSGTLIGDARGTVKCRRCGKLAGDDSDETEEQTQDEEDEAMSSNSLSEIAVTATKGGAK